MELYLGHGIGFGDDFSPWGTARIGKIGTGTSVYNTYRIPFGASVRVTAQRSPDAPDAPGILVDHSRHREPAGDARRRDAARPRRV